MVRQTEDTSSRYNNDNNLFDDGLEYNDLHV